MNKIEGLYDVNWDQLAHAYGGASNVPDMLLRLGYPNDEVQHYAFDDLYGSVLHQGSRYSSTIQAIPFLFQLMRMPETLNKPKIFSYLRCCLYGFEVDGYVPFGFNMKILEQSRPAQPAHFLFDNIGPGELEVELLRKFMPEGRYILSLLDDPAYSREEVVEVLMSFGNSECSTAIREKLRELMTLEDDPNVLVKIIMALALHDEANDDRLDLSILEKYLHPQNASDVRVAAAFAIGIITHFKIGGYPLHTLVGMLDDSFKMVGSDAIKAQIPEIPPELLARFQRLTHGFEASRKKARTNGIDSSASQRELFSTFGRQAFGSISIGSGEQKMAFQVKAPESHFLEAWKKYVLCFADVEGISEQIRQLVLQIMPVVVQGDFIGGGLVFRKFARLYLDGEVIKMESSDAIARFLVKYFVVLGDDSERASLERDGLPSTAVATWNRCHAHPAISDIKQAFMKLLRDQAKQLQHAISDDAFSFFTKLARMHAKDMPEIVKDIASMLIQMGEGMTGKHLVDRKKKFMDIAQSIQAMA